MQSLQERSLWGEQSNYQWLHKQCYSHDSLKIRERQAQTEAQYLLWTADIVGASQETQRSFQKSKCVFRSETAARAFEFQTLSPKAPLTLPGVAGLIRCHVSAQTSLSSLLGSGLRTVMRIHDGGLLLPAERMQSTAAKYWKWLSKPSWGLLLCLGLLPHNSIPSTFLSNEISNLFWERAGTLAEFQNEAFYPQSHFFR